MGSALPSPARRPHHEEVPRLLHSSEFPDLDALITAAGEAPALFVAPVDALDALLLRIAPNQDVVVDTASDALIAHRRQRLAHAERLGNDRLTGLMARQPFLRHLEDWPPPGVERPVRSLLVLDLDRFKAVNDRFGHLAGDQVLAEVGQRVREALPDGALGARIGGEEIAVVLEAGHEEAMDLARRLHGLVREKPLTDHRLQLTVSVAVATAGAGVDAQALLNQADGAVYAAKAAGRDRVVHASDVQREAIERDIDPAVQGFENMTRVIADRVADLLARRGRALFEELQEQAEIDALTGLYTRRYLDRRLAFEIEEGERPFSAALVDIDHFGNVNKEHGWPSGDRVLAGVAARIVSCVRETDWVARYGGEEFLVVLPGAGLSEAHTVLERIRLRVGGRAIETTDAVPLRITVSAGVVELEPDESLSAFKERMSSQLLAAKRGGRNRVQS